MKRIFIYYSLSGNGEMIANYLKDKKTDIRKVVPKKELPKNMFFRIMSGGFLAGINHRDELIDFDSDISKYDEVIIGSPIWNGRLSCPINTVLDKIDVRDKKLSFILYSGSGACPKTDTMLKEKYKDVNIIHLKEPKSNKELLEVLKDI